MANKKQRKLVWLRYDVIPSRPRYSAVVTVRENGPKQVRRSRPHVEVKIFEQR